MERAAQIGHSLAADLATVASNDERRLDLAGAGLLNGAEVRFAAGHAGATHRANLAHARPVEDQEHELDERVAGKLLELAQERATAGFAVTLDRGVRLGLETRELPAEQPVGERDPAHPRSESERAARWRGVARCRPGSRGDLRLRLLQIAAEATAPLRCLGNLAEGDLTAVAVERVEPKRDRVGQIAAGQIVERGPVGEASSEIPSGLLLTTIAVTVAVAIAVTVSIAVAISRSRGLRAPEQARPRLPELALPRRTPA